MRRSSIPRAHRWAAVLGAVVLVTACTGLALAAKPVAGASYSGRYKGGDDVTISFTVSANGKRVTHLDATTPIRCPGAGGVGGVPGASNGSGPISRRGTFRVSMKLRDLGPRGKVAGTEVVTGTFESRGRANGKVTSHLFNSRVCHGRTVGYTAKEPATG